MNYTQLAGHLGADPETRFTPSGKKVTTLRVACRARKDQTIWWRVTVWGDQFDRMMSYFKKGSSIIVFGELNKPEIFTDREGKPQISLEVVAHHISFSPFGRSGGKSEGGGQDSFQQDPFSTSANSMKEPNIHEEKTDNFLDEEIPF